MTTDTVSTVRLTPRGWTPDPTSTAGDHPPQALWISRTEWERVGRPASIEDFTERTSCMGGFCVCPRCGKSH